jgi:predicted 3-demethylubiquinone-9 3-methyltransferase (glyoxalase superfamily)
VTLKRGRIAPCLWFDSEAEEAAGFYVSIFPNSFIGRVARFPREGQEVHGRPAGSVMTVEFELDGVPFTGLNGGPAFTFNEAVSLQIFCSSQDEIDHFWDRLTEGGDRSAQQCGWLKDRFGVSWQVVPDEIGDLFGGSDRAAAQRAMRALLGMKKIEIPTLKRAYAGERVS